MKLNLIKKYILIGLVLTSGMLEAKSEISLGESALNWAYTNLFVVLAGVVILGAFLTLFTLLNNLLLNQRRELLISQGVDVDAVSNSNKTPFFTRLYSKAWSLVPMDKENDIDLGHDYDGIRELDNRLPPWWVYLFYITILWAGVYIYYSHFRENKVSQSEEYYAEMEEAEEKMARYLEKQANSVDESNVVMLTDAAEIESGKKTYLTNCIACHGPEGQGGIGPNLTDKYWIHGGSTKDIFKTIKYGVTEKGMESWKSKMSPSTMQKVASFIKSLEGTDPPNAKAPQGILYEGEESQMTMNSKTGI